MYQHLEEEQELKQLNKQLNKSLNLPIKQGKKKTVWFNLKQLEVLDEIFKIAPREINTSSAIRIGLELYLEKLNNTQEQDK